MAEGEQKMNDDMAIGYIKKMMGWKHLSPEEYTALNKAVTALETQKRLVETIMTILKEGNQCES